MTKEEIISGSKLIAQYMNFLYLPFSAELKEKGMKAGYYKTVSAEPQVEKIKVSENREIIGDINFLKYNIKNGWKLFEGKYYKYVCRNHGELRYWNSLDSLVPVIKKIEEGKDLHFELLYNGCILYQKYDNPIESYDLPNWSNNVFKVVVEFLNSKK